MTTAQAETLERFGAGREMTARSGRATRGGVVTSHAKTKSGKVFDASRCVLDDDKRPVWQMIRVHADGTFDRL